jgi:hypothetical protein
VCESGGRRNCGPNRQVRSRYGSEEVLHFANFLQFTITSSRSESDEARLIAFDYEAAALRKMKNFTEPPQTLLVTPAVQDSSESPTYLNVDTWFKCFKRN